MNAKEKRLLIVDDEENVVYALRKTMAREGYQIDVARSPEGALAKMSEFQPQVVILDIRMPSGEEGIQVLQEIKRNYEHVEVVMLTALAEVELVVRSLKFGAYSYTTKPWETEVLREIVNKAFHIQQMQSELERKTIQAQKLFTLGRSLAMSKKDRTCLIPSTIEAMCELINGQVCYFGVTERENGTYLTNFYSYRPTQRLESIPEMASLADFGIDENVPGHEPQLIVNLHLPALKKLFGHQHAGQIRAIVTLPLRFGGKLIGYLIFYLHQDYQYFDEDKTPLQNFADNIAMIVHSTQLIETIRKQTEELARKEKDAALGAFFAQIIHRIAHTIGPLQTYVNSDNPEDKQELLRIIGGLIQTTDSLKQYARGMGMQPQLVECDLAVVIEEALIENSLKLGAENIVVSRDFGYDQFKIKADRDGIRTMMSNLITNAADSFRTLQTSRPREIKVTVFSVQPEKFVSIRIEDNGCGIRPELEPTIFEPFVSTKNNGLGLGLSIVKNIAKSHGGEISFSSKPGEGTIFIIQLPQKPGE
jgi:signal transduction histidine kinase/FixJ family two-component response regulator